MCWLCGDQNPDCVAAARVKVLLFTSSSDHQVCLTKSSVGRLAAMLSTLFLINRLFVASCSTWQCRYTKLALLSSLGLKHSTQHCWDLGHLKYTGMVVANQPWKPPVHQQNTSGNWHPTRKETIITTGSDAPALLCNPKENRKNINPERRLSLPAAYIW